jgi:hypothetical protein
MTACPDPRDVCDRCRQSFDQVQRGPIVHDHIWQQLTKRREGVLCAGCMYARTHERLGRVLTLADLQPCPWNLFHRPHSWFDFFVEIEGAPPSNLAEWRSAVRDLGVTLP